MESTVAKLPFLPPDREVELAANMLRAALAAVPEEKRRAAADRLVALLTPPKVPAGGGPVLKNVIQLFKEDRRSEWTAAEVLVALGERGHEAPRKAVYNALNYLSLGQNSPRRILRKIGYGRYQLEDGSLVEGPV